MLKDTGVDYIMTGQLWMCPRACMISSSLSCQVDPVGFCGRVWLKNNNRLDFKNLRNRKLLFWCTVGESDDADPQTLKLQGDQTKWSGERTEGGESQ